MGSNETAIFHLLNEFIHPLLNIVHGSPHKTTPISQAYFTKGFELKNNRTVGATRRVAPTNAGIPRNAGPPKIFPHGILDPLSFGRSDPELETAIYASLFPLTSAGGEGFNLKDEFKIWGNRNHRKVGPSFRVHSFGHRGDYRLEFNLSLYGQI
jgi:hypothetical protein